MKKTRWPKPKQSSNAAMNRTTKHRKKRRLTAERLIKLLRKHGTLTLVVCVLAVSVVTGYIAIELGA
jgi:hypothetical protein